MIAKGKVHKFGDNVDTDVIIPARYLNKSDEAWLASHCMEDIDKGFVKNVQSWDFLISQNPPLRPAASAAGLPPPLLVFFTAMPLTSALRS